MNNSFIQKAGTERERILRTDAHEEASSLEKFPRIYITAVISSERKNRPAETGIDIKRE